MLSSLLRWFIIYLYIYFLFFCFSKAFLPSNAHCLFFVFFLNPDTFFFPATCTQLQCLNTINTSIYISPPKSRNHVILPIIYLFSFQSKASINDLFIYYINLKFLFFLIFFFILNLFIYFSIPLKFLKISLSSSINQPILANFQTFWSKS